MKKRYGRMVLVLWLLLVLAACTSLSIPRDAGAPATASATRPAASASAGAESPGSATPERRAASTATSPIASAGSTRPPAMGGNKRITVLYTNDEHGWIAPVAGKGGIETGGSALLLARWQQVEGYRPGGPFLVLSGGDMWTGPAISTWFNGDPAALLMNRLGYQAAAIGNHDFDFGLDVLRRHASESKFPYLAANLVQRSDGQIPDFARPFTVLTVDGVRIGLIGLSSRGTPQTTRPSNVAEFKFLPYEETLRKWAPQAQAAGADFLFVIGHLCSSEMRSLAPAARALGITLLTGGHCHERVATDVGGLPIVEAGKYMESYARVDLDLDLGRHVLSGYHARIVDIAAGPENVKPDAGVTAEIAAWQAKTDAALGEVIGYTAGGVPARSDLLYNLVTDAWLRGYPQAQVAVTNKGGFRQGIPAGPIRLRDVVSVLPFNDTLVDAAVTGAQLRANLACCGGVVAGLKLQDGRMMVVAPGNSGAGQPLDDKAVYHVLINDFMATGGDNYKFAEQDPQQYFTGIDWRQPVIEYIKSLGTSEGNPLEAHLDATPRPVQ